MADNDSSDTNEQTIEKGFSRVSSIHAARGRGAAHRDEWFYLAGLVIVVASLLSLGMAAPQGNAAEVLEVAFLYPQPANSAWNQLSIPYRGPLAHLLEPTLPGRQFPDVGQIGPSIQHYVVRSGDTFSSIWGQYGKGEGGGVLASQAMLKALASEKEDVRLRLGERIELTVDNSDITQMKRVVGDGKLLTVVGSTADGYQGHITEPQIVEEPRIISGAIHSSFSEAARTSLLPYDIVDAVVDLFDDRIDFSRDLREGDTFAVKFIHRSSDISGELTPGAMMAASLKVNGKHYAAFRYVKTNGESVYLDEEGQVLGGYFLKYPVRFSRISSVFSDSRLHPVLKQRRPHYGVDFAAPIGTPVRSVADGVVIKSGRFGGAGNMVKIKHNERYSTAYLHLSRIGKNIKVGTRLKRGQVIGQVGMTGLASGPHLHYSLYDKGKYIDPLTSKLKVVAPEQINVSLEAIRGALRTLESYHSKFIEKAKQA
jgi:murein DD-endopeptidase MepM/ murein hydrolase activator NlpD